MSSSCSLRGLTDSGCSHTQRPQALRHPNSFQALVEIGLYATKYFVAKGQRLKLPRPFSSLRALMKTAIQSESMHACWQPESFQALVE